MTSSWSMSENRCSFGHYEETAMKQTIVRFRNGVMLAIARGFAESHDAKGLVIAAHAG